MMQDVATEGDDLDLVLRAGALMDWDREVVPMQPTVCALLSGRHLVTKAMISVGPISL
jgi:hypothetical protein